MARLWIESARLRRVAAVFASCIALAGIGLLIPELFTHRTVNQGTVVLTAVMAALALQLLTGFAGQLSIGSGALMGIGAFTVAITKELAPSVPFAVLLLCAGAAGAIVGLIVGLPALRIRGFYLIIATLALHYIVIYILQDVQTRDAGAVGYFVHRPAFIADDVRWYYFILVAALVVTLLTAGFKLSGTGRAWQMITHNEIAAEGLGVDIRRMKLQAFVLSSFVTAIVGALVGYTVGVVTYDAFRLDMAIQYIAIIIIAGLGSTSATWLGAAFVIWIPLWLTDLLTGVSSDINLRAKSGTLLYGAAIVLFMMFVPGGLNGIVLRAARSAGRALGVAPKPVARAVAPLEEAQAS